MKLAILASGNGTNAQAIVEAARDGRLDAEIKVILTNRPESGVIARAEKLGIPIEIVPSAGIKDRRQYDTLVVERLAPYKADAIALAGWMRILSDVFLDAYKNRIINLHPAILPSFTGGTGIQDAFDYGVKLAGCTVHLVNPVLDGGPIVIQAAVPVKGTVQELEAQIHKMEHLILPQALQWMSQNRIEVEGRCTRIKPSPTPVNQIGIVDGCLISPALETRI